MKKKSLSLISIFIASLLVVSSLAFSQSAVEHNDDLYKDDVTLIKSMMNDAEGNRTNAISISAEELEEIGDDYRQFVERKLESSNINSEKDMQHYYEKYFNEYIEYYAEQNGINLNDDGHTKHTLRALWTTAVGALVVAGYEHTPATIAHSLQDNPPTLEYQKNSTISSDIRYSSAYINIYNNFLRNLPSSGVYYSDSGSFSLTRANSSNDLYLSLHAVNYLIAAEKVNNEWTIYTWIYDYCDFKPEKFNSNYEPNDFVTFVNNFAVLSQALGAIQTYPINIYIEDTH